jgi:undecaprenyl-diphosphatase
MAVIQAVTAFFPIGSTGHLHLLRGLAGWPPLLRTADLAAHTGMLIAVAGYFWRDILGLAIGFGQLCRGRMESEARLLLHLVIASLPGAIAVLTLATTHTLPHPSPAAIAWFVLLFGIVLFLADRIGVTVRRLAHMTWSTALIVGLAQIVALAPGVGRPGIVVTLCRGCGFERAEAARFSLLLALPTLVAAIVVYDFDVAGAGELQFTLDALAAGVSAFMAGFAAIAFLMNRLKNGSFAPFALYRIAAGAVYLAWMYFA